MLPGPKQPQRKALAWGSMWLWQAWFMKHLICYLLIRNWFSSPSLDTARWKASMAFVWLQAESAYWLTVLAVFDTVASRCSTCEHFRNKQNKKPNMGLFCHLREQNIQNMFHEENNSSEQHNRVWNVVLVENKRHSLNYFLFVHLLDNGFFRAMFKAFGVAWHWQFRHAVNERHLH